VWNDKRQWSGYTETPRFADGLLLVVSPITLYFHRNDRVILTASRGDVVYVPQGSRYLVTFENGGGNPDLYTVNFLLCDHDGNVVRLSNEICLCGTGIPPEVLGIADALSHEWLDPRPNRLHLQARLFELLSVIADNAEFHIAAHSGIRDGIRLLIAEWNLNTPIDRYAEVSGVSIGGFYRLFKSWAGISPNEYRTRMRISAAKSMLRNSSLSIREIAMQIGYSDPYYFSRCFRRSVGVSPLTYRTNSLIP
ncbi:MAG: helix-turn-helix transcriptional regulator, partial [Clostridia bacterium]|nr:helix-turn-helix transcriptional regulator [Clostridia bacterium]